MEEAIVELRGRMSTLEEAQRRAARKSGGTNGVLLARLDERVEGLTRLAEKAEDREERAAEERQGIAAALAEIGKEHAACAAVQVTRWDGHEGEHKRLQDRSKIGDIVAYLLATLAAFIGIKLNA